MHPGLRLMTGRGHGSVRRILTGILVVLMHRLAGATLEDDEVDEGSDDTQDEQDDCDEDQCVGERQLLNPLQVQVIHFCSHKTVFLVLLYCIIQHACA